MSIEFANLESRNQILSFAIVIVETKLNIHKTSMIWTELEYMKFHCFEFQHSPEFASSSANSDAEESANEELLDDDEFTS